MKASNTSPYACMYLVTKEVYDKLLLCIDERDKKKIAQLNRNEVGNENGAFPDIPPPPPPIPPPPPPPQRHPSTISSDDDAMDSAPDTSPPDTPRAAYGQFIFPDEENDNYIDDDIASDTNNLYIDRPHTPIDASIERLPSLPVASIERLPSLPVPGYNFARPQTPAQPQPLLRPSRLINNFKPPKPPTQQQPEPLRTISKSPNLPIQPQPGPSTSTDNFKKGLKTNNKALIKKSKKPVLYKHIPKAKEVQFEIVNSTTQSDITPTPPRAPENNQAADANISNLTRDLGDKLRRSNKCPICGIQFLNRRTFLKHQKDMHSSSTKRKKPRLFVLGVSKKESRDERQYDNWVENNMDVVTPDVNVNTDDIAVQECRLCNTEFNKQKSLVRHLAAIHDCDANYKPFTTPETKNNKRKLSQTKFVESKTPRKKLGKFFYKCKLCSFLFSNEQALERHSKNIHDILNVDGVNKYALSKGTKRKELAETEIFKCNICSTEFENKSYYISHLRLKHGVDQKYTKKKPATPKKTQANKPNKKTKRDYDSWQ